MEKILCAAIWYAEQINLPSFKGDLGMALPANIEDGYVLCGYRHPYIISLNLMLTGKKHRREDGIEGFLTSYNRFVNRHEAWLIANAANQIIKDYGNEQLFSESLYKCS